LSDRIHGGAAINLPGAEEIEIGSLGLNHVETANRTEPGFRRVHCVSNPCTFKINELVVGVTSTDILFHTSLDETNANLESGARLGRISQHMLQQRSYYPLFPPADGANLDLKRMDKWKIPCQPDLLIIPSKLNTFARNVLDKTVVVNPGHLTRATTGGTYAMMEIHPLAREVLEGAGGQDVKLQHGLSDRIRIEIKRI
jgi:DNA polymerase alpha subunit B